MASKDLRDKSVSGPVSNLTAPKATEILALLKTRFDGEKALATSVVKLIDLSESALKDLYTALDANEWPTEQVILRVLYRNEKGVSQERPLIFK